MTELEKIEYTKMFIDKLANGVNPIDNTEISGGDIVNNVRISRCLFYVSEILGEVIKNGGVSKKSNSKKLLPFEIIPEQIERVPITDEYIGIKNFVTAINEQIDCEVYKKLKVTSVTEWLVDVEMLYNEIIGGKKRKKPTSNGKSIGITTQVHTGQYGEYEMVLYGKEAQQFILDNIDAIVAKNNA